MRAPRWVALGLSGRIVAGLAVSGLAAPALVAQQPVPQSSQLATVTTDTGDMSPGHRNFARYADPLMCLAAARTTLQVQRTSLAAQTSLDTLQYLPEQDTLPAQVAVVARACGGHFTAAGVAPVELPILFELALLARNDALAQAVVMRRLVLAPTDTARWTLKDTLISRYLAAEPARVAAAAALAAQLDSDSANPAALLAIGKAHQQLMRLAEERHDTLAVQREAARIIALCQRMTEEDFAANYEGNIYMGGQLLLHDAWERLLGVAYIYDPPDSLVALARRLKHFYHTPALHRYEVGVSTGVYPKLLFGLDDPPTLITWTDHDIINWFEPASVSVIGDHLSMFSGPPSSKAGEHTEPLVGDSAPPIQARYWFPAAPGDTMQPAPGHVSLIINSTSSWNIWRCLDSEEGVIGGCWFGDAHNDLNELERVRYWLWRYGRAGLKVTVVASVQADSQSVFLRGPVLADTVARTYAWFLHDVLHTPATLAVDTTPLVLHYPEPDGRKFYDRLTRFGMSYGNTTGRAYSTSGAPSLDVGDKDLVLLVDRTGKIIYRYHTTGVPDNPIVMLDWLLEHQFGAEAKHSGVATVGSPPAVQSQTLPPPAPPIH